MVNKKIGITGHNGVLGYYLKNPIRYNFPDTKIIDFERSFFQNKEKMSNFVRSSDVIIHLAGLNRHNSQDEIKKTNIEIAKNLSISLTENNFKGLLIYSSSLQENNNTPYGISKREAGEIFNITAKKVGFSLTILILPNIFGPYCKPNYNSFISTFSHQLINGNSQEIIKDQSVPLIYVESAVSFILSKINSNGIFKIKIPHECEKKVSQVLSQLKDFYKIYFEQGNIPKLQGTYEIQLFNTFRAAIDSSNFFPKPYNLHKDERGYFSELIRTHSQGQQSYSVTKPGVTRGNHFHKRKIERFSVIQGEAKIKLRRIGSSKQIEFKLSGKEPSYIDIPVWTTHNIKNIGRNNLITIFWINEHYDTNDPDVYFEKV